MGIYLNNNNGIQRKTLLVAVECMENILECDQNNLSEGGGNPYLIKFEQDGLLDYLEELCEDAYECVQESLWEKVNYIIQRCWY